MKSSPHSPQLQKAHVQQGRPTAAKKKKTKKKLKNAHKCTSIKTDIQTIESPEINLLIDQSAKAIQWGKDNLFNKW